MATGKPITRSEVFSATNEFDEPVYRLQSALINGLNIVQDHLYAYVEERIKEVLKDWEPTQNIKLTVEVVNDKDN